MLRRSISAIAVVLILGGFVLAETVRGIITAVEDGKIKVTVFKKKGDKEGEEKTFKINSDTKYFKKVGFKKDAEETKIVLDDVKKAVAERAKAEKGPKGVFAAIEVEDGTATKVTQFSFGKRPGGKDKRKKDKKDDI